jgi:hypothetical protein
VHHCAKDQVELCARLRKSKIQLSLLYCDGIIK